MKKILIGIFLFLFLISLVSAREITLGEPIPFIDSITDLFRPATISSGCNLYNTKIDFALPYEIYVTRTPSDEQVRVTAYQSIEEIPADKSADRNYCQQQSFKKIWTKYIMPNDELTLKVSQYDDRCYKIVREFYICPYLTPIAEPHRTQSFVCLPIKMSWEQMERCVKDEPTPTCRWCPDPSHNSYYDYFGNFHCATEPLGSWCEDVAYGKTSSACVIQEGSVFKDCDNPPTELAYTTGFEISNMEGYYCCFVAPLPEQIIDSVGDVIEDTGEAIFGDVFSNFWNQYGTWIIVGIILIILIILLPQIISIVKFILAIFGVRV